jgi:hypothetical protein
VAAFVRAATGLVRTGGPAIPHHRFQPSAAAVLQRVIATAGFVAAGALASLLATTPAGAASNKVRVTNLSDVVFGTIANLSIDATRSQNVCLYADTASSGYNVTATGTGPGGAFQLSSGPSVLSYEVQWSSSSGRDSGVQLTPNTPLTGQASSAAHQTCNNGPATSASLLIMLRSTALSSATAGSYTGTLTLIVGAE